MKNIQSFSIGCEYIYLMTLSYGYILRFVENIMKRKIIFVPIEMYLPSLLYYEVLKSNFLYVNYILLYHYDSCLF